MFQSLWSVVVLVPTLAWANPYPDPNAVPKDRFEGDQHLKSLQNAAVEGLPTQTLKSLRVSVTYDAKKGSYTLDPLVVDESGTPALYRRALRMDVLGSHQATLSVEGGPSYYSSIGTGKQYRALVPSLTFRFPLIAKRAHLMVTAENLNTGKMERVLDEWIDPSTAREAPKLSGVDVRVVREALKQPALRVVFYAEGFSADRRNVFEKAVADSVKTIETYKIAHENMQFVSVFAVSKTKLGKAADLGLPVKPRDSFLGLYHPYWNKFGRWYHVVYPTQESKYRDALSQTSYDYPIAIVDSSEYWGVGNYNALTAIPSQNYAFSYLLMHEFGHFFGLNEEYEGGGPTELEFSRNIEEPWSQNITFQTSREKIKWKSWIAASTPVPTSQNFWKAGAYGAYLGGYADSEPRNASHKPGMACTMEAQGKFCGICLEAIAKKVSFDLGQ